MPNLTGLTPIARIARIATLPETRGLILAAVQSETLRDVARRAVNDRAALVRDLSNPANARNIVRSAAGHPAARELASAGLMFLPGRYLPLGWAATWAAHRVLRDRARRPMAAGAPSRQARGPTPPQPRRLRRDVPVDERARSIEPLDRP